MAPEQAEGRGHEVGPLADVYALGTILYECLTGRPPFRGVSPLDTLLLVRSAEPVPPRRLQPHVPRDLEIICLKCLQKDPRRRYPSAAALAEDLGCFREGRPIAARPAGLSERAWKWARRRPAFAALLAVSVVTALSLVAFSWSLLLRRVEKAEHEVQLRVSLDQGREACDRDDLNDADQFLGQANGLITSDPSLLRLQDQAVALQAEIERKRGLQQAAAKVARDRADEEKKFLQFRQLEGEARQHGVRFRDVGSSVDPQAAREVAQFGGFDLPINPETARTAASKALALYGVTPETTGAPAAGPYLDDRRRQEVQASAYELLLIWAEALARPEARGDVEQALRLLDRAATLGPPARVYHLRRARYLEWLGRPDDAAVQRALAEQCPPRTALDYFLLGEENYRLGRHALAGRYFENALVEQPDHFWARYFHALTSLRLGDRAAAVADLTACAAGRQDFVWIYVLRGYANGARGRYAEAEQDFAQVLAQEPGKAARYAVLVNRGFLLNRQEKWADAEGVLREAAEKVAPEWYQAYENLADTHLRLDRSDEALADLARAITAAETLIRQRVAEPAAVAHIYTNRALLRLRLRAVEGAMEDVNRAIDLVRDESGSPVLARALFERGSIFFSRRDYARALNDYDRALALRPDYTVARRWRGETLLELHRYTEAVCTFTECLQAGGPGLVDAHLVYRQRGQAYLRLGDYARAISDYTESLTRKDDPAARLQRGWAYLFDDAPRPALADFEVALKAQPNSPDAHNGRGMARAQLGEVAEGIRDAAEAARLALLPAAGRSADRRPHQLWGAARVYAQAIAALDRGGVTGARWLLPRRPAYEGECIRLLGLALEAVPTPAERAAFWKENIQKDGALQPVRAGLSYATLAAASDR